MTGAPDGSSRHQPAGGLDRLLHLMSVLTLLMTVPQLVAVWRGGAQGVSLWSWATYLLSACLWLVYGLKRRDRTIYIPCIGWILLDAGIVAGVLVRGG